MGARHADFEEYVAARWQSLVRTAIFLGCRPADAQDLVQTALAKCFIAWAKVSRAGDRDAYVYRVLVNALRDEKRRLSSRETPTWPPTDAVVADRSGTVDVAVTVEAALAKLGVEQRQVLTLRFLAGLSERQTAQVLGVPVGTVKSRAARSLTALSSDTSLSELREGI